ncbi:uncharacterized protein (TIGR02145 family) [Dysgonomonas alginatilytica]|uniref:Uncharacterized protein (TIGR02145 family) n=1 Tax=Dysgonomonas alginatilytica TaxID=1605892 RepID=A0A2V3PWD7_9BACT|nr:fibrobacter succinogenes major paralogous domain-containing protein [Dysgonomonas alginatilytica]PXV69114.1 uncharacterized protein (TIGR02145 family) [Dysgonomonas alginatilytica]
MNQIAIKSIIFSVLFLLGNNLLFAQVTIGSDKLAAPGSLLQLKEFETDDERSDGKTTSTRGVAMPRVLLRSVDGDLAQSLGFDKGILDKKAHIGLTVYNASDLCASIVAGIYVWDGDVWEYLGGTTERVDRSSFNTVTGILSDFEGNKYTTQVFGTKRWMTQNLRAIRKADGSCIDPVDGVRFNPAKNGTVMPLAQVRVFGVMPSGNVTYTENSIVKTMTNEAFVSIFGLFYTWNQAMVACPKGWHLASVQDWTDLTTTLGITDLGAKLRGNVGATYKTTDSGVAYKWGQNDPVVTISGFNILPAGWVREDGLNAVAFSTSAYLWTSAPAGAYRYLSFSGSTFSTFGSGNLNFRFSVRCVQDQYTVSP